MRASAGRWLMVVVIALTACGNEANEQRTPAAGAEPSPSVTEPLPVDTECPNQSSVLADPSLRRPGVLSGDVDAEGTPDDVAVYVDPRAPLGCQAFLSVDTGGITYAAVIRGLDDFALTPDLPRLDSIVPIDALPGSEVVIGVVAGASTEFVEVFTLAGGILAKVDVIGRGAPPEDRFASGGSVGHLDAVDCTAEGEVVASFAEPVRVDRYRVIRRFIDATGAEWRVEAARNEKVVVPAESLGASAPEFDSSPFLGCG